MAENYKIKDGLYIMRGRQRIYNEDLTDEMAEELLKQKGMERTIEKIGASTPGKKASPTAKDESGSGKK